MVLRCAFDVSPQRREEGGQGLHEHDIDVCASRLIVFVTPNTSESMTYQFYLQLSDILGLRAFHAAQ